MGASRGICAYREVTARGSYCHDCHQQSAINSLPNVLVKRMPAGAWNTVILSRHSTPTPHAKWSCCRPTRMSNSFSRSSPLFLARLSRRASSSVTGRPTSLCISRRLNLLDSGGWASVEASAITCPAEAVPASAGSLADRGPRPILRLPLPPTPTPTLRRSAGSTIWRKRACIRTTMAHSADFASSLSAAISARSRAGAELASLPLLLLLLSVSRPTVPAYVDRSNIAPDMVECGSSWKPSSTEIASRLAPRIPARSAARYLHFRFRSGTRPG